MNKRGGNYVDRYQSGGNNGRATGREGGKTKEKDSREGRRDSGREERKRSMMKRKVPLLSI